MLKGIFLGNLTRDAEVKTFGDKDFYMLSGASNNGKDKDGKDKEPTYVTIFARKFGQKDMCQYYRKGAGIYAEGVFTAKTYDGRNGVGIDLSVWADRVEITRFVADDNGNGSGNRQQSAPSQRATQSRRDAPVPADDSQDDLPF